MIKFPSPKEEKYFRLMIRKLMSSDGTGSYC